MGRVTAERRDDGAVMLTLDDRDVRNALDLAMIKTLTAHLADAGAEAGCRVVVIRGAGHDFCAGRNIRDVASPADRDDADLRAELEVVAAMVRALYDFPKPLLSVVDGYALGLGGAIAALSDVVIASSRARFGFPEVGLGIPPSLTTVALVEAIGHRAAMPLLLTGERIEADRAERIGLVTQVAPPEALDAQAAEWVRRLAAPAGEAVVLCKRLERDGRGRDFAARTGLAIDTAIAGFRTDAARRGREAFERGRRAGPDDGGGKP